MANEIKVFSNDEFGKVRVLNIDNEPWFVGRDVAEVLGYSNTRDAISKHVDSKSIYTGCRRKFHLSKIK